MVHPAVKRLASPLLDPLGNRLLSPPACGLWGVHLHGDRQAQGIALTFDDGPVAGGTERVLDTLAEFGVSGTFFFLGVNALHHPELVRRTVAEGHVVGNHSMQHSRADGISLRDRSHFLDSERVLRELLGGAPRLYRSPWGWSSPWEVRRLRAHGLEPIGWDIYTPDWRIPSPDGAWMGRRVVRQARPGSIVLLHDGYTHAVRHEVPQTVRALRTLIPPLKAQGFTFVTVAEMLGIPALRA